MNLFLVLNIALDARKSKDNNSLAEARTYSRRIVFYLTDGRFANYVQTDMQGAVKGDGWKSLP